MLGVCGGRGRGLFPLEPLALRRSISERGGSGVEVGRNVEWVELFDMRS